MVEGHAEVAAAPHLVRRIGEALSEPIVPATPAPVRIPKSKLLRPGELERAVRLAALNAGGCGVVMVLLDSDDDCPATLGPELYARAVTAAGADVPVAVVLAKCEFETWFIAAVESLRGIRGLPNDVQRPAVPEDIRGAKEWLGRLMADSYAPTLDQVALADEMDLDAARTADSFDKFWRETERLLQHVRTCNWFSDVLTVGK